MDSLAKDANGFYDQPDTKKPAAEVNLKVILSCMPKDQLPRGNASFIVRSTERREAVCSYVTLDLDGAFSDGILVMFSKQYLLHCFY